jgi:hypothetical protein
MSSPTIVVHQLPSFLGILIPNATMLKLKVEGKKSNMKVDVKLQKSNLKMTAAINDIGTKGLNKVYCNERFNKFLHYFWVQ